MMQLKSFFTLFFCLTIIVFAYTQKETGSISTWHLVDTPHGVSESGAPDFMAIWEVKRIDDRGGEIRVKLWPKNKTHCAAFADFKWDFSNGVGLVNQYDLIETGIAIDLKEGDGCNPPLDPTLKLFVMKGVLWDEEIGGGISYQGQDLFGYATEDDKYQRIELGRGSSVSTKLINLMVKDQTGIGRERDAEDGGFFLELSWRGNKYNVFYKYSSGPKPTSPATVIPGGISSWYLADTPNGITSSGAPYYLAHWEVKKLNAQGGKVRAKMWKKGKPECFAFADFTWDFSQDLSNVVQNDRFSKRIAIDVKPGADCNLPLDPKFNLNTLKGVIWNEKIGGDVSLNGQDLFSYATEDDQYKKVDLSGNATTKTKIVNMIVNDQTDIGEERDAEDGGFFLEMSWRGNKYNVFYKYLANFKEPVSTPTIKNSVAGKWDTKWIGGSSEMTIVVDGNNVIGTYPYKDGRIEGQLTGNIVKGMWYQSDGKGEITITFNSDFTKFTTRYKSNGNWYSDWIGTRMN